MDEQETAAESSADPLLVARSRPRLAGLVMAVVGLFTFGLFSPFGLVLSAEKFWEPGRSRTLRVCDIVGVVLAWIGNIYLPYFLYAAWMSSGPEVTSDWVVIHLTVFTVWMAHRVFVVWRSGVTGPWAIDPDRENVQA